MMLQQNPVCLLLQPAITQTAHVQHIAGNRGIIVFTSRAAMLIMLRCFASSKLEGRRRCLEVTQASYRP
jgi:hypothetical protein